MTHNQRIIFLLTSIFVAGIGLGITLPVLPFYAERLMGSGGASASAMALHVTGLTSVYALAQFLFAPMWGALADGAGRKRVICLGIVGAAFSQVLFGVSTSLTLLYGARLLGGFLSASMVPAATAYVADLSTDENRSHYMAWMGTVSSLATVAGVAFGGAVVTTDFHVKGAFWHLKIDAFSLPFFTAAVFMLVTAGVVWLWLPESERQEAIRTTETRTPWAALARSLLPLLSLAVAGQIALTAFEATFPLFAEKQLAYGTKEVGLVFMVCGLVMGTFQVIAVDFAARRMRSVDQLSLGFVLMGAGMLLLLVARPLGMILTVVGVLALGMAFLAPNLSSLAARGRGNQTGAAMGLLSAANSLGQVAGPLIGGALFAWRTNASYIGSGTLMLAIALLTFAARSRAPFSRGV